MTKRGDQPAFPDPAPSEDGHLGMTLREWYVGQALAGGYSAGTPSEVAQSAWTIANQALVLLEEEQD